MVAEGAVASFHWVLRSRVAGALYKMKSSGRRRPWKFRPTSTFLGINTRKNRNVHDHLFD